MLICLDQRFGTGCGARLPTGAVFCPQCGGSLRYALELHDPGTCIGAYRIVRDIGFGGFGAVYEAEDGRQPGRRVALKESFDPAQLRSFQSECAVLRGLQHDHLPCYHEVFAADGNGYLVMELVPGQSLAEILDRRTGAPLVEAQVLGYALQVCDALSYLHEQTPPILHRDIKPANIRLTPDGLIKLVDFGLLKQGTDATRSSRMGLTPAYAPLEQYGKGMHTGPQSDIYSLGATLYHLLSGTSPLSVTDRLAHTNDPLLSPRQHNPRLSAQIAEAVMQAMAIASDQRYPTAAAFRAALTQRTPLPAAPPAASPTVVPPPPAPRATPPPPPPPPDPARAWLDAGRWQDALNHLRPRVAQGEDAALLLLAGLVETAAVPLALRLEAAGVLGANDPRLLDPQRGTSRVGNYWYPIEAGAFWAGSYYFEDKPPPTLRQVKLPYRYQIARYPVTNAEYARFMAAGGYRERRWWTKQGWVYVSPQGKRYSWESAYEGKAITQPRYWEDKQWNAPTQPVVGVSWYEAAAYCVWLTTIGQHAGWLPGDALIRLPTTLEWERAARHTDQRMYPWGNDTPTPEHANAQETGLGGTSPVGCFPAGAAVCGTHDLSGNVWEWTATPNGKPEQMTVEKDFTPGDIVVLRGGAYRNDNIAQACGSRFWFFAYDGLDWGFRVVWSLRSSG